MHFVAMLAFSMPGMAMSYAIGPTLFSLAIAITFTAAGFATHDWRRRSALRTLLAGLLIGCGVVSMHYLGMAAMQMQATLRYDPEWVAISIAVAIVAATAAVWLAGRDHRGRYRVAAAIVMGAAIAGMHYAGMQAAIFTRAAGGHPLGGLATFGQTFLAAIISLVTVSVLLLGLGAIRLERMFEQGMRREARLRFLGGLFRSSDPRAAMAAATGPVAAR